MSDLFDRPPDLETPKVNLWTQPLPDGAQLAPSSLIVEFETEEPYETRVYAILNEPRVSGWLFKILSKTRKSDGYVTAVSKLQDHNKYTVFDATTDWMPRDEFQYARLVAVADVKRIIQAAFPDVTLSEPTVTDGKTMLRMMQEARA